MVMHHLSDFANKPFDSNASLTSIAVQFDDVDDCFTGFRLFAVTHNWGCALCTHPHVHVGLCWTHICA